jgi:hypothetical protein
VYGDLRESLAPLTVIDPTVWSVNTVGVTPVLYTNGCKYDDDPLESVQDWESEADILIVKTPSPCAETVA